MEGRIPGVVDSDRTRRWAATMAGHREDGVRTAHADSTAVISGTPPATPYRRRERERAQDDLAEGATRAVSAGRRARAEEPDDFRTCFERDRDRILHSAAFRRLAG
ncbi:MAG: HD domain-containing protein, partial [Acidimicrobiales bacterium]